MSNLIKLESDRWCIQVFSPVIMFDWARASEFKVDLILFQFFVGNQFEMLRNIFKCFRD